MPRRRGTGSRKGTLPDAPELTELRRAQDRLDVERRRLLAVLEGLPVYAVLLSRDYLVPFANKFFRDRFGEAQGRHCYEYLFGRSEPCEVCESFTPFRTGRPHRWPWTGPDGRDYDIYDQPFTDTDGTPLVLEMGVDVTEERRLARTLRTLNLCNEALVRATDEQQLLREICRILVDEGGYRLSWVGWAVDDPAHHVRPAAWGGEGADYVREVDARWDASERGAGPTGRAIRERATVVQRHIATDPAFEPWRAAALAHGYGSSIAAPIVRDGAVLGALMVYAADPDAFDERERTLIEELAGDIGFGVGALRDRAERARAEAALQRKEALLAESEAHFRALIENASDLITVLNADFTIRYHSPSITRLLGYAPDELIGTSPLERIHEHDVARVRRLLEQALSQDGVTGTAVYRARHKNGSWRYHESVGRNLMADPAVRGAVINTRDITERVRAEQELRASDERFRNIVLTTEEGVWVADAAGRTTFVNERMGRMLGYPAEDLLGRNPLEFVDPASAAVVAEQEARRARGERSQYEVTLRRRDGGAVQALVSASPILARDGTVESTLGMITDITALRRADAERQQLLTDLRNSEARLRALVERASDMIAVLGADARLVYASPAMQRMLGYEPADLLGTDMLGLVHPDDAERVRQMFAAVAAEPDALARTQYRFQHRDGSWRLLESVAVNRLDDPALGGIVVNTRDVSERAQLEQQLHQAQRLEAVGRLAGGVAHDFNNILTVIQASAQFLLDALPEGTPARSDALEIYKSSQRASGLTRQLLAFSRRQTLQPRELDLNVVVADMEEMLRRLIGEDVELAIVGSGEPLLIQADLAQIEQVVLNFVVNARDAMPHGGRLTIETRPVELDERYAATHPEAEPGPYALLSVTDTGTGMGPEVRDRVFEPFFTTKQQGTGLGLATVYGIIKQSGGSVWVYSEVGKGTSMKVYLPRSGVSAQRRSGGAIVVDLHGTETVLVAEDEASVRDLARRSLEKFGYRVLVAEHSEQALALAASHQGPIDLLLTDVVMPGLSGRDLARRLLHVRPGMHVLYMSGYPGDAMGRQGVLEPGLTLMEKPFSPELLARKAREALATPPNA